MGGLPRWVQKPIEVLGAVVGIITGTEVPKKVDTEVPEEKPGIEEVVDGEWPPSQPPPDETEEQRE
jgi:hypothetical protein